MTKLLRIGYYTREFFKSNSIGISPKIAVILAILYIICPLDLLPDWLPVIGWAEDLLLGILTWFYMRSKVDDETILVGNKEDAIDVEAKVISEDEK